MKQAVLILDLGMVLFRVNYLRCQEAFREILPASGPARPLSDFLSLPLFHDLETGKLGENEFPHALQAVWGKVKDESAIIKAWNAMLEGVIPGREEDLKQLARHNRLFLLSNTNRPHFRELEKSCATLFSRFEKCYFSFDMGMRKPDPEIYLSLARQSGFDPAAAVMVDDLKENLDGAAAAGMGTFWFRNEADWQEIMHRFSGIETKSAQPKL